MPRLRTGSDVMVELEEDDKKLIRKIGYERCAELLDKSEHYLRGLASRGKRKMRLTDIEKLRKAEEWWPSV